MSEEEEPAPVEGVDSSPSSLPRVSPTEAETEKASDGRRLLITKMVMENFKSYGGVREIGPFHKCFSSIVGPNGSGKSNVIDAMLFVFGKRAKKLRLNKVSELIHRSDTYPDLDYAKVEVHFVDILDDGTSEDAYTEIPGTQLVVTRTAYRNNSSKYTVDGKTQTFNEVGALLRRRGIDLDNNRFLILQGEVEQIALMKPKGEGPNDEGLLEYLEDIIGSNRYVEDTEKAAAEVEALNEQRSEKLRRLQAAEKEKESLQGAKEEAESYLKKEALIRVKRNELYQVMIKEAEKNATTVKGHFEELAARKEKEMSKLAEAQGKLSDIEGRYEGMTTEYNSLTEELKKRKAEFAEYERKDIKFQEDSKFYTSQVRKLETALKRDATRGAEAIARSEAAAQQLPSLRKAVENATKRLEADEAALELVQDSLKGETGDLRNQLEAKQLEAAPARAEASAQRTSVQTLRVEVDLLEEPAKNAVRELERASTNISELAEEATRNEAGLARAKEEAATLSDRVSALKRELEETQEMEKLAAAAMTSAMSAAEEAKASRDAAASAPKVLRGLMSAAKKGGPLASAGVCGRLGDLGTIDPEYDVAVSTACSQLDFIVVETAAGGQACVEYLRDSGLGRASFIILEKLGHLQTEMKKPFSAPAGSPPRLFDLIRPTDKRFLPAFYMGLRDTLVATHLDSATAVAYRGDKCVARVVTLDGQLIDRSGTMSGGGGKVRRGGMSTGKKGSKAAAVPEDISDADLRKLEAKAADAQADVKALRDRIRELQDQMKALARRERDLVTEIPKLQLALDSVEAREAQIRSHMETLKSRSAMSPEDEAKARELREKLKVEEKALAKVEAKLGKIEEALAELQASIMAVGGDKLLAATKAVERSNRACDEAVSALNAAEVEAAAEAKKAERAAKDAERCEEELAEATEQLEACKKGALELEQAALVVMTAYNESKKVADDKKEELEAVTKEYEELKALETRIRKVEVDITNQLEEYQSVAKENDEKASYWRGELDKVRRVHKAEMEEWCDDDDEEDNEEEGAAAAEKEGQGGGGSGADAMDVDEPGEAKEPVQDEDGGEAEAPSQPSSSRREATAPGASESLKSLMVPLVDLSDDRLARCDKEDLKYDIGVLEGEREAIKNDVNMTVLLEYKKKEGEYLSRVKDLDYATDLRNTARRRHEDLRRRRLEEFMTGFGKITLRLKEMYQMITLGGDAELELVDSLDPFSEGIVFSVRPPKKSWKNIANLSGGEKTLSSLALVFALHHFKPTPLYVMDEIDAALDFKNVSIVANYIKERTKNAQFIIISLRNNMFELADRLVGIYKTHNVTKSVTINPKQFTCGRGGAEKAPMALVDRTNVSGGAAS